MRVEIAQPAGLELGRLHPQRVEKFEELLQTFFDFSIPSVYKEKFADLYAQTLSYGLFFSRIRAGKNGFSRQLAYRYIPKTLSILQHLFYLLTGPEIPESLEWIVDEISEVLANADLSQLKKEFHTKT